MRVEDDGTLWWPDYPGNNMFNSMGNLAENAEAALLFVDFDGGTALHLTGRAEVACIDESSPGDDGGTGRRVRFIPGPDRRACRADAVDRLRGLS